MESDEVLARRMVQAAMWMKRQYSRVASAEEVSISDIEGAIIELRDAG
jgi:hypothetical protein